MLRSRYRVGPMPEYAVIPCWDIRPIQCTPPSCIFCSYLIHWALFPVLFCCPSVVVSVCCASVLQFQGPELCCSCLGSVMVWCNVVRARCLHFVPVVPALLLFLGTCVMILRLARCCVSVTPCCYASCSSHGLAYVSVCFTPSHQNSRMHVFTNCSFS